MKRTPMPRRKTWMRRRNPERLAKRRAEQFGPQAELCRSMPCCVCWTRAGAWCAEQFGVEKPSAPTVAAGIARLVRIDPQLWPSSTPSDPHHIVSRGAGGTDRDCVPLCRHHHDEVHRIGRDTFQARHGVDLRAVADALAEVVTQ